jgi:antimicrobial peptide system SdpA family protein
MDKRKASLLSIFFIAVLFYVWLFAAILVNYAGNNPLNKLNSNISSYVSVFPQGWAFFTRPVHERSMALYAVDAHGLSRVELRGFEPEYYFGASRRNRILTIELSNILYKIEHLEGKRLYNKNIPLDEELNKAVSPDTLSFNKVARDGKNILLRGKYVLVLQDYLPWSLMRNKDKAQLSRHLVLLPFEL